MRSLASVIVRRHDLLRQPRLARFPNDKMNEHGDCLTKAKIIGLTPFSDSPVPVHF